MSDARALGELAPQEMTACPVCDLLHRRPALETGSKAVCARCGSMLLAARPRLPERLMAAALTSLILMGAALWFPFMSLSRAGASHEIHLIDAPFAMLDGWASGAMALVMATIIVIPALRSGMILYVTAPMAFGRPAPRFTAPALRFWAAMRPWAMAEIFMLGVAISAVKLGADARIELLEGFWAFALLAPTLAFENAAIHGPSLWAEILASQGRA